jgi:hypothetical protein
MKRKASKELNDAIEEAIDINPIAFEVPKEIYLIELNSPY